MAAPPWLLQAFRGALCAGRPWIQLLATLDDHHCSDGRASRRRRRHPDAPHYYCTRGHPYKMTAPPAARLLLGADRGLAGAGGELVAAGG